MKALVCHALTGIEGLRLEQDWPEPALTPGSVLVDVAATALNFPDVLMLRGLYQERPPLPFIPGLELAGEVVALGEGVKRWKVGDKVTALVAGGGYAEFCVTPAAHCLPLPEGFDLERAAAIPENFFTVWTNLIERARLAQGETVLIHGGSGGDD